MNTEAGININGVRLSNLRFADDIILKDILEDLSNEGKGDGMKLKKENQDHVQ